MKKGTQYKWDSHVPREANLLQVINMLHLRIQRVLSENFDNVFFFFFFFKFDEGNKDPNTTISGPSTGRQRNAI